jgi:hypothetical protein
MRGLMIAAAFAVAACGEDASQEAATSDWLDEVVAAAPAQDWIEVPLTENVFRQSEIDYRTDEIDIEVPPLGGGLEYKLAIREGDAIAYAWTAGELAAPELFLSEFHGHTERVGDAPGTVMFYRRAVGGSESGALVAPFDGVHGWYFQNSGEEAVVVRLRVAGFYELIPEG